MASELLTPSRDRKRYSAHAVRLCRPIFLQYPSPANALPPLLSLVSNVIALALAAALALADTAASAESDNSIMIRVPLSKRSYQEMILGHLKRKRDFLALSLAVDRSREELDSPFSVFATNREDKEINSPFSVAAQRQLCGDVVVNRNVEVRVHDGK